jgi:hypothetical protein
VTNFVCARCKNGLGYCKNWDGHGDNKILSLDLIPAMCKLEPEGCEYFVQEKK